MREIHGAKILWYLSVYADDIFDVSIGSGISSKPIESESSMWNGVCEKPIV